MENLDNCGTSDCRDEAGVEDKKVVLLLNEIELLLAEKRTALSVMRTGIAIIALPLSVFSILIATSKFYEISNVIHFLIPVLVISAGLIGLSVYLIVKSLRKFHILDKLISEMKKKVFNYRRLSHVIFHYIM